MSVESFVDTNVLVYLVGSDLRKSEAAEQVLLQKPLTSVQVLNEFTNVARRKKAMSWTEIAEAIDIIASLCRIEPLTIETHRQARILCERYALSFYDGLIAASALLAGCDRLMSEDMQHGLLIERKLRVHNPFAG